MIALKEVLTKQDSNEGYSYCRNGIKKETSYNGTENETRTLINNRQNGKGAQLD